MKKLRVQVFEGVRGLLASDLVTRQLFIELLLYQYIVLDVWWGTQEEDTCQETFLGT